MKKRSIFTLVLSLFVMTFFVVSEPVLAKTSSPSSTSKTSKSKKSKSKKTKKKSKKSTKKSKSSKSSSKAKSKDKAQSKAKKTQSKSKSKARVKTGKVNINTADAKTLTELTGIGPVTAKKIIAYRKKNGKFRSADDLLNVHGIGEKTMKKMKSQLKF